MDHRHLPMVTSCAPAARATRLAMVALALLAVSDICAQEAVRTSWANDAYAGTRFRARNAGSEYYNIRLGPAAWTFGAGLSATYTDNLAFAGGGYAGVPYGGVQGSQASSLKNGSKDDLYFVPSLRSSIFWPITEWNRLQFTVNAGYIAYTKHSDLSRPFISADPSSLTELSFDLLLGEFVINFHERPSITEQSYMQDPTVGGINDYAVFNNSAGVAVKWNVERLVINSVNFGFEHMNTVPLSGATRSGYAPNGSSDSVYANAGYSPKPGRTIGLELGATKYDYAQYSRNQGTQWSTGAFFQDRLTSHLDYGVHVGYSWITGSSQVSGKGSYYAYGSLTHQLNEKISHTLSGGRTISLAYYGGNYIIDSINWTPVWQNVLYKITVGTSVFYSHYTQDQTTGFRSGNQADNFNNFGANLTLSRPLMKKLSSSFSYQYAMRDGAQYAEASTINSVTLNLSYRF